MGLGRMQELKSQQPELPGTVATLLSETGWVAAPGGSSLAALPAAGLLPLPSTSFPQNQQQEQQQQQKGVDIDRQTSAYGRCPNAAGPAVAPPQQVSSLTHRDFDVPGLTITSFHLDQLRQSLQLLPEITHGWLVHELTDERIQEALAVGCRQLCPRANVLTADGVQRAVSAGLSVRAWGIKDMQLLRHVEKCGCHGATVNWPRAAREELLLLAQLTSPPADSN
ncbi:hypothetical protein Vafri_1398 [Volvox africanus]|nr:hypothetical protein Vafri_1398 [Volvox africanus]